MMLKYCRFNLSIRSPIKALASVLVAASLVSPQLVMAQKKTDASAEQRRAEQLRKLSAQNQQLEADKAKLTKEKEDVEASAKLGEEKIKAAEGQSTKLSREVSTLRSKNAELDKTNQAKTAEIQKLTGQLAQLTETTKAQQAQIEERAQSMSVLNVNNTKLQTQLKETNDLLTGQKDRSQTLTTELGTCSKNNSNLVGLVDELSDKYRKKSCMDARSIIEPLMGLRGAEFERVAEEYRAKAGDERYVRPVGPATQGATTR
jgi:chromosome segregation ATPase